MQLKEKVVVITGGSKGFGRALAEAFIKEGSNVAICAVNEAELNRTCDETGAFGVVADVREEKEMQKLFDKVIERFGALDIWVNNAGVWLRGPAEEVEIEKVKTMFDINVMGVINGSRVALRKMKAQNSGVIINISSRSSLSGRPEITQYSASKWAVNGFTYGIREENKDNNISVFLILPGGMKTTIFGSYKYPNFDKFTDVRDAANLVIENLRSPQPKLDLLIEQKT